MLFADFLEGWKPKSAKDDTELKTKGFQKLQVSLAHRPNLWAFESTAEPTKVINFLSPLGIHPTNKK